MIFKSKLHQMTQISPTDYWNDSCSVQELTYAVEHGAVGATTNPTIVVSVLKKEMHLWKERIYQIITENPTWTETQVTWKLIEEMAVVGSKYLLPAFEQLKGKKGRLSIQTNPAFYRDTQAILDQTIHFHNLAPNMIVKIPVTHAGVAAIEEATFKGVSINATVSFSVPQAIAVAEAVERGLNRRAAAGLPVEHMGPVCTIMIGRLDDWLKVWVNREHIPCDPAALDWAGIAAMKNAYAIFQQRGYRARLLAAAYRHLGHWSELIGGEMIASMPYEWQLKANASQIDVQLTMHNPVDPAILASLQTLSEFRRAYQPDGMRVEEFDTFGATLRTLRGFIASNYELVGIVRDFMLPNPDIKPT